MISAQQHYLEDNILDRHERVSCGKVRMLSSIFQAFKSRTTLLVIRHMPQQVLDTALAATFVREVPQAFLSFFHLMAN